jgi:integrase
MRPTLQPADPSNPPAGVTWDASRRRFVVEVRVRPYPKRRKRFPASTPAGVLLAWRQAQLDELTDARRDLQRAARATADPLLPAPKLGEVGTFRDDVEVYLADPTKFKAAKGGPLHPHTAIQFRRWLRQAAATDLGRYPRQLIPSQLFENLLAQWESTGCPVDPDAQPKKSDGTRRRPRRAQPMDVDTANKCRSAWMGFYRVMDAGSTLKNPIQGVKRRTPKDAEPRGIPMADALRIVEHLPAGTKTYARLMIMITLGLRPCEVMRIQPAKDWHRAAGTLYVRTAKGGKPRTLRLNPRAVAALELLQELDGWGTFTSAPACRMFHEAVRKAGLTALEPIVPYALRHSFGTEAYRLTGDVKAVAAAIGNTVKMAERYVEAAVSAQVGSLCDQVAAAMPKPKRQPRSRGALREVTRK